MKPPRVLIIAGSDSGGGAGIQADIKTVTMLGGFAMNAITAITAQNSLGVTDVLPVPTDMVLAQIDAVLSDLGADAVKIGMIGSAETALAVAERLAGLAVPIVFDPVMVATSGATLADDATIAAFERLMAVATLVTPNLPELEALTGTRIGSLDAMEGAARALSERAEIAVLAKGGHLDGDDADRPAGRSRRGDALGQRADRDAPQPRHRLHARQRDRVRAGAGACASPTPSRAAAIMSAPRLLAAPGYGAGHGPMGHALGVAPFDIHRKSG